MNRVVLAVDGSEGSLHAARTLKHLARIEQLVIVYAVDIPRLAYPATTPGLQQEFAMKVEQAMRQEGQDILDRTASTVASDGGSVQTRLEAGTPVETVLAEIERSRTDLLVIGSRGLGPVHEHLLGSVSHRLTTHAACSTLVVKAPMPRLRHLLLPVESRADAEAAIAFLNSKPFGDPVKVTVLHVLPLAEPTWPAGVTIPESLRGEMIVEAERVGDAIASELTSPSYQASGKIAIGAPAAAILQEALESRADLILMRSRIRSGVSRLLLGSVSHAVTHHTSCSVLLIR